MRIADIEFDFIVVCVDSCTSAKSSLLILILTVFLVRPLQEGHGCITSKMIKYNRSSTQIGRTVDGFGWLSSSANDESRFSGRSSMAIARRTPQ